MKKSSKKTQQKYYCKHCDYSTSRKSQWDRHKTTAKHLKFTNDDGMFTEKVHKEFRCENCNKTFNFRQSLWRHKKQCKKIKNNDVGNSNVSKCFQNVSNKYICGCGRKYKSRSGLYKHTLKCIVIEDLDDIQSKNEITPTNNVEKLLKNILEENKVLRKEIKNLKLGNTMINSNNNNNNSFNINMFLNEKCKNAMNLEDFVEKIKLSLEDLQFTKDNGYAKGISNIFIKNLNDMDITERPIHCSDQKRLQFYVKNDDEWAKDKNNEKIDNTIEKVSRKQIKSIQEWVEANPDYTEYDAKIEEYFTLVRSITQPNDDKNLKNIKRKVGVNVKLEKSENVK